MKKKLLFFLFYNICFLSTNAQCAMCRAVLETEEGQGTAAAINDGIMYLMLIPYILIGGIAFVIYTSFTKKKK